MRSLLKLIVLSIVAAVALAELYKPLRDLFETSWMAPALVHSALSLVVLGLAWRQGRLGALLRPGPLWALIPAAVVLVGSGLMILASRQSGTPEIGEASVPWAWILWVPVVEELVFRAGIGDAFRKTSGHVLWGSWFSALSFALVHTDPTLARLGALDFGLPLGPFLLGISCEALYVKTRSIIPAILLHAACNATAALFLKGDARWLDWLGFLYS